MKYDVCVFGGCSLDMTFFADINGNYRSVPDVIAPGGKGSNQAVAAARAGAHTTIITRLGKDEIGDNIFENFRKNNVDVTNVDMVDGLNNDAAYIYVNHNDKDNKIKRVTGAIDSFTPDMIDRYKDVLLSSKIVLSQMKAPKEVSVRLINFCYENHIPIVVTPCRPKKLFIGDDGNLQLIDKITYITCNRDECIEMFGTDDFDAIVSEYPRKVIITLGSDGLIYNNGSRTIHLPAPQKDVVVDTTGAGDTFAGNFAAFIAQGLEFEEAIDKAQYASGMKIRKRTAQEGMPYIDELNQFYNMHKKNTI